jgi:hypothetical protein
MYVYRHNHDLVTKETTKILPRHTRRQNTLYRKTGQEFYLRIAFWETASIRISKASRRPKQGLLDRGSSLFHRCRHGK